MQIVVKAVNNIAGPEGLVSILLVFRAYPRITRLSTLSPSIIKRAKAVRTAMAELRQLNTKQQVKDALAIRNGLNTANTLNLSL